MPDGALSGIHKSVSPDNKKKKFATWGDHGEEEVEEH
jgi:hypothetical protein